MLISVMVFFLVSLKAQAQVFVPYAFWQDLENCTSNYCPTLSPVAATLQGTAGMTQLVSTCVDDGFTAITFPFEIAINNTNYATWYFGSNAYITATAGSAIYSPINASSPALPKFMIDARDDNYQRLYSISGTNYIRVRYEGNSTYNTCSSINMIWEITFFRPTVNYQYVQVVFGTLNVTTGAFGVANASTFYASTSAAANSSFVLYSYNGGTTWFILPNYSITGAGTTL